MRLRTKVFVGVLLIALLPLLGVVIPSLLRFRDLQKNSAITNQNRLADNVAEKINTFLEERMHILEQVGFFFFSGMPKETQNNFLERLLLQEHTFHEITVVDVHGQEIIRKRRSELVKEEDLRNIQNTEAFKQTMKNSTYVSTIYFRKGRPMLDIGIALRGRSDEIAAILATIDAISIQETVENVSRESDVNMYLVDREGRVVAHTDLSVTLRQDDFSNIPIVQEAIAGNVDFEGAYKNEAGISSIGLWRRAQLKERNVSLPWYIIVEQPVKIVFRDLERLSWLVGEIMLLAAVLAVIASFLFSRTLTRSFENLTAAFLKLKRGNFVLDLPKKGWSTEITEAFRSLEDTANVLRRTREREEMLSRMKSEFVSIAAHQLRTPLSAIKWIFQMLLEGDVGELTEEQRALIERGKWRNERLIEIVHNLLNVSQIEEGKFGYEFKKADFVGLVERIIKEEKIRAEQKNILFEFKKPQQNIPRLKIDPSKITMAVTNLIDNAIKYTPPGGKITVTVEMKGREVEFSIKDTGIGIPPHQMSRLFTKFFRGENAIRLETEGSGFGLFVAKNIIERHGGKIWAESKEGEGSTFFFTLPIEEGVIPSEEQFKSFVRDF